MKQLLLLLFFSFFFNTIHSQSTKSSTFIIPEILTGMTMEANEGFPETNLESGLYFSFGTYNNQNKNDWAKQLNYPKTGVLIGITDYGNKEKVGKSYSILPFLEFDFLKKWSLNTALGASYVDTKYSIEGNRFNKAISTDINWAFRAYLYYNLKRHASGLRVGLGYAHSSNGHTRLPNQGLNSVQVSLSYRFNNTKETVSYIDKTRVKSSEKYLSTRFGFGINVLSEIFNDKKPVYSFAFEMGKIVNKTFKFGGGFYYRFYQHYYDYIVNEEALIDDYPVFKENPFGYATNFGVYGSAEVLLSHIGIEFQLGLNVYKPFYKVDWRLNQGYSYIDANNEIVVILGELDWYYEIKRTVTSRLGLNYYFIDNNKSPKHNFYIGAHINANLGQADFTDVSFGYIYRFHK